MFRNSTVGRGLVLVGVFFLASSAARAGDDCDRDCKRRPSGDVESLNAKLDWRDGEWLLHVRYKLEIEDAQNSDRFDLVLIPTEGDHALADRDGQSISLAVSLPVSEADCDDDEMEFRDEVTMQIPEGLIGDPYRVRVRAELVDRSRDKLLDDDSTKVKVCSLPCEVVEVSVRHEVRYEEYPPPPVVYVEPAPVYCPPPIVYHRYVRECAPVYDCGPRYYPGRSFGFRADFGWDRGWGRGWGHGRGWCR